jgi:hypothetical protein
MEGHPHVDSLPQNHNSSLTPKRDMTPSRANADRVQLPYRERIVVALQEAQPPRFDLFGAPACQEVRGHRFSSFFSMA